MKSAKLFLGMLLLTSLSFVTSCGEDGDAGPAGEKGEKGDKGDMGEPGPAGQDGAGVIYSPWLSVEFVLDDGEYYATLDVPKLTNEILSAGDVRVYINLSTADDPMITPLPYIDGTEGYIRYGAYPNGITIQSSDDVSTDPGDNNNPSLQYRYVLIPGSEAARKAQDVNWNDYAAVKAYLKLAD